MRHRDRSVLQNRVYVRQM